MQDCVCAKYRAELHTAEEVRLRYQVGLTIAASLDVLATSDDPRRLLLRCRVCGQYWQQSADLEGRLAHYAIPAVQPTRWARNPEPDQPLMASWRSLFLSFGPECGPEPCRAANCRRLRVRLSVFCMKHHYALNIDGTLPAPSDLPCEFRD